MKQFEERRNALMRWNLSDEIEITPMHLMPYILTSSELIDDLLTELRRMYQKDYALFERHSYDDVNDEEFHIGDLLVEVKELRLLLSESCEQVDRLKRANDLAWSLTKEAEEYE